MGVLAGLRSARTPWLLTCPGDTPYLDTNWHHALIAQAVGANLDHSPLLRMTGSAYSLCTL